ncbi:glutathione transferase GST 23-like isoform X2 [Tasmannia lanceolata]|uniref:glutathione transferase GST 23-like isoform X2 n=1 Tax=Tasmannia lanceolata TaxID=3420 RepID=UPI004064BAE7
MGSVKGLKLHGMWASSFCIRVELALKLKGIPYEYVEEDLENKSQMLVHYNPVYKKVPVLIDDGKSIAESMVILEYIEDKWKDYPLLPEDLYMRAKVQFWAKFFDEKLVTNSRSILKYKGEEQEKAIKEFVENLTMLEEGIEKEFSGGKPFFNGERPGLLDLVVGSSSVWHRVLEDITGVKLIERQKNPLFYSWLAAFWDLEVVKDVLPSFDRLVAYAKHVREKASETTRA